MPILPRQSSKKRVTSIGHGITSIGHHKQGHASKASGTRTTVVLLAAGWRVVCVCVDKFARGKYDLFMPFRALMCSRYAGYTVASWKRKAQKKSNRFLSS